MSKKIEIKNNVALVTGANRGIGKAITIELLEQGAAKVYAGARDISTLDELKAKYEDRLVPIQLDVTDDNSIAMAAQTANDVSILVNNAGIIPMGSFLAGNVKETLKQNLDVNLWGVVNMIDAFLKTIQAQDQGAIATVSSMAGLGNMSMMNTYSVSKAAVHSLMQGLRAELADTNILVSGIYPGPIDTDMTKGFDIEKESPENVAKNVVQGIKDGVEDIFPDPMSQQMGTTYMASPKEVEKQFAQFKN